MISKKLIQCRGKNRLNEDLTAQTEGSRAQPKRRTESLKTAHNPWLTRNWKP